MRPVRNDQGKKTGSVKEQPPYGTGSTSRKRGFDINLAESQKHLMNNSKGDHPLQALIDAPLDEGDTGIGSSESFGGGLDGDLEDLDDVGSIELLRATSKIMAADQEEITKDNRDHSFKHHEQQQRTIPEQQQQQQQQHDHHYFYSQQNQQQQVSHMTQRALQFPFPSIRQNFNQVQDKGSPFTHRVPQPDYRYVPPYASQSNMQSPSGNGNNNFGYHHVEPHSSSFGGYGQQGFHYDQNGNAGTQNHLTSPTGAPMGPIPPVNPIQNASASVVTMTTEAYEKIQEDLAMLKSKVLGDSEKLSQSSQSSMEPLEEETELVCEYLEDGVRKEFKVTPTMYARINTLTKYRSKFRIILELTLGVPFLKKVSFSQKLEYNRNRFPPGKKELLKAFLIEQFPSLKDKANKRLMKYFVEPMIQQMIVKICKFQRLPKYQRKGRKNVSGNQSTQSSTDEDSEDKDEDEDEDDDEV